MASIVKAYNCKDDVVSILMLVGKNLEALVYYAKYHWHQQLEMPTGCWKKWGASKISCNRLRLPRQIELEKIWIPVPSMLGRDIMVGLVDFAISFALQSELLMFPSFMLSNQHMMMI
jgi:hypothetical protein